ncbi:cell division cycle-associated 7-like protein [Phoenix dactylifera]|uniref:Cell division cycle-associated 7-like protein n=1 Tax=Phoenix dactylifera TaxID=42345 RepID=A0A8B7C2I2_PHODC|nr:cell division cycle-associated 7-like protein [Phoenix dactylifera]
MVTTRKRAVTAEVPASPAKRSGREPRRRSPSLPLSPPPLAAEGGSGYEKFREERIKENLERMQRLGILQLKSQLDPIVPSEPSKRPYHQRKVAQPSSGLDKPLAPTRRSSRLQNIAPVSYAEIHTKKDENLVKNMSVFLERGANEEVYADEHEKLLGTCETTWTLFVDGYGKDGRRIYDQIKGKTCHQCRQKTLGYRTHCSKCKLVQGQFCGDCLYMRYGEHVLEVNKNPKWLCPVCRGICNCSLCRIKKGWAPTGPLYKKVSELGFKSVAHYLIQTRRSQTDSWDSESAQLVPLRNSPQFADAEDSPHLEKPLDLQDGMKLVSYGKNGNDCSENGGLDSSEMHIVSNIEEENVIKLRSKSKEAEDSEYAQEESPEKLMLLTNAKDSSHPKRSLEDGVKLEPHEQNSNDFRENSQLNASDLRTVGNIAVESVTKLRSKNNKAKEPAAFVKASPDCIAGRLRKRPDKP